MREDYTLLTPENVELRYDIAGVGSRLTAAVIDYTILIFFYFAFMLAGSFILAALRDLFPRTLGATAQIGDALRFAAVALVVLLAFFGWWGYFVLFEVLWNGQTPGKRALRLRVVVAGGQPVNATASLVRNVLRIIDLMLLIGVVVMLVDRSSRRLGDLAAGSLVVREPAGQGRGALAGVWIPEVASDRVEALPNADRLTMAHYTLIRDFFARRDRLQGDSADALAQRLATDLAQTLDVPSYDIGNPDVFLATAAHAFEARHRYYDSSGPGISGPTR
jgi:uncharacterized RDD family membrane protein YckC